MCNRQCRLILAAIGTNAGAGLGIRGDAMKQSMIGAVLLLVAAMTQESEAATCRQPDISADRIQAMSRAAKGVDDTIAECGAEIHRLVALGNQESELAAAYEARAFAYEVKGMGPEAKADYDQAVDLEPGFITWFNRSQFLIDAGLYPAAVDDLSRAIDLHDRTPARQRGSDTVYFKALFQRAEALRRNEQYELAAADYGKVIGNDPRDSNAIANRAICYSHLGELDLDIADLTRFLELKKNDPIAYYNRGLAFRRKGDDAKALDDFSEAADHLPGMATAHLAKAEVLEYMGQRDKALAEFRAAAKIDPTLPAANAAIARLGGP
jgi:tetratricopeptide (TPR) repeat protein